MRPERSRWRGGEGVPSEKYMETQGQKQVMMSLAPGSVSSWRASWFPAGAARRRSSRVWECLLPAPHIPSPFQADIPERSGSLIRGLSRGRIRSAQGAVAKRGQRDSAGAVYRH